MSTVGGSGGVLERVRAGALDLLFPKRCLGCRAWGALVCDLCRSKVDSLRPPFCLGCGAPANGTPCGSCRDNPLEVDGLRSVFPYEGLVRAAIIEFKYHGLSCLAGELGVWMADRIDWLEPADVIAPVPLHRWRERDRGYNQSALLAQSLQRSFKLPLAAGALQRTRPTPPQVHMSGRKERAENVQNAFIADRRIVDGRSVLIVDDVATTGTTVSACARALKDAGAARVMALTLARDVSLNVPG
ncbi:MAG: ComF family protein [Dehalococcoidia bacterium]|nr:ComF family protein [Dehalococcoidia bacterium]